MQRSRLHAIWVKCSLKVQVYVTDNYNCCCITRLNHFGRQMISFLDNAKKMKPPMRPVTPYTQHTHGVFFETQNSNIVMHMSCALLLNQLTQKRADTTGSTHWKKKVTTETFCAV